MKLLFSFISVLVVQNLFGQYKIDPKVQVEFDSLYNTLPKEIQKKRYLISSTDSGFSIFQKYKTDTLNAKDYKFRDDKKGEVILMAVDPDTDETVADKNIENSTSDIDICLLAGAAYSNDTLYISSHLFGFGGFGVMLKIYKGKCFGTYMEYGEKVYRNSLKSKKIDNIEVSGKIEKIVLSKIPKKIGEMFYGKASFTSLPFYQGHTSFKKGYIHKRHIIEFIFSCKLSTPAGVKNSF